MAKPNKTTNPPRFSDSFTTEWAEFSVGVITWPGGEAVKVAIDCNGEMFGDEVLVDTLIEMLEKAKENLLARRPKAKPKRASRANRAPVMLGDTIGSAVSWTWNRKALRHEATTEGCHALYAYRANQGAGGRWIAVTESPNGRQARTSKRYETPDEAKDEAIAMLKQWLKEAA
jgi:hypothetical protein